MIDAWKRGKKPEDDAYFALADKIIDLAHAQIAKSDTAEMHFYAGMGLALKVRLEVLRGENRAVARAGVPRAPNFCALWSSIRKCQTPPPAWASTTTTWIRFRPSVKILRFFMGIPGGSKTEGIRQMQVGIDRGVVTPVEMRFHLAKNLRTFDQQYERAIVVARTARRTLSGQCGFSVAPR